MNKRFVSQSISILLALGLLWYVLKDVPLGELADQFQKANYWVLLVAAVVFGMYYLLRAIRWMLTLQALHYSPSLFRVAIAILSGAMASMIIPGAGELTRCGTLQRTDGIPLSHSVGSVAGERVIDLFVLLLTLLLTVLVEFVRMKAYLSNLTLALPDVFWAEIMLVLVVAGGLIGWWLFTNQHIRQHRLTTKVLGAINGFREGFLAIRRLPKPALFVWLTVSYQLMGWAFTYLLLQAFDVTRSLPPSAALTILTVSSLGGIAVPTQGGIGTYHFFVSRALVLYGFTTAQGATAATFLHAVGFGFNLIFSGISFLIIPFLLQKRNARPAAPVSPSHSPPLSRPSPERRAE
ncbi:lysylphosphatidylglycerol synthase transmembrane domain-containing protein [Spirosoma montaniterrae]|uniref:lysylphosphatidylglycerol synthase transmembrane domain-containing protein n=1 Tax=Spirosoma montaniterrae TaxID=1178516 RepID=UPI00097E0D2D|nr:lysylphosphatidylglycerol synthase transmembrane domain-containing protein [Spirosoma montaniterrae]